MFHSVVGKAGREVGPVIATASTGKADPCLAAKQASDGPERRQQAAGASSWSAAIDRRERGEDDRSTFTSIKNLADVLLALGRFADAVPAAGLALRRHQHLHG